MEGMASVATHMPAPPPEPVIPTISEAATTINGTSSLFGEKHKRNEL